MSFVTLSSLVTISNLTDTKQKSSSFKSSFSKTISTAFLLTLSLGIGQKSAQAAAQVAAQNRIVAPIEESTRVTLQGNMHMLAKAKFDRGIAPASLPMDRMLLLLSRSPAQETALEQLLAEQQDPSSPNYHAWLSPQDFGAQFGPSDSDIATVTNWLTAHGFAINSLSSSKTVLEFSGTASQVQQAFHTEIHKYLVPESPRIPQASSYKEHWANSSDPQIPAALAPVITGVVSLNDFGLKPMHRTLGPVITHAGTSVVTPQFSLNYDGTEYYGLSPYDFATLYNLTPLWNAGITGSGETIGIVGQTTIKTADVAAFRKAFGLPALAPTIIINGTTPPASAGDEEESDLDVEWAGAVAKAATIKFVTSASTSTTSGVVLSAQYIVDKKVATIMSVSYGECELGLGTTENQFFNSLWQQAASEGISVFVAAGDSGSAGCDSHDGTPPFAAEYGLQVNGLASTPYNVAVGGTDLGDYNPVNGTNTFSTYWSTTNAANGSSLKKYVPEVVWNDSCTIGTEATCNNSANSNFVRVDGGSGGKSACTTPNTSTDACSGGYAKPSWQAGTGVPADGKRDLPDLSLFAGDGERGTFYLICDSTVAPCTYTNSTDAISLAVGGTSASSPSMAGIQALVNQKLKAAQGNPNPTYYALAKKETLSGCNSTNGSGSTCVFNDITSGTNAMPCYNGTTNCTVTTSGDEYGILPGYKSGAGFDLASGLGSVNANNLVNQWPGATPTAPKVTLSATSEAFGSQAKGTTSAAKTVTVTNSGTATLTSLAVSLAGTNPTDFAESTNCGTSLAVNASCTITLEFKPASTASYAATVDVKDNATGSPQTIALTGTGVTAAPKVTLSATSVAFGSVAKGTTSPAKTVTVTNTGTAILSSIAISLAGTNPTDFVETNKCSTSLAVNASCVITLEFKPASTASYTATVDVKDNATGSPQTIALTGTGVVAAPKATLSATSVAFGNVAKGTTSVAKTVTLTNTGTETLSSIAITLTGTDPADFIETNKCATTLAINASCVITLEFKPAAAAAYTATVDIKDNAAGSPQTIALTGTGITTAPKVTLSATSEAFGNQTLGTTSATKTVTVTNSGTATLSSLSVALAGTDPTDFTETSNCATTLAVSAKCTITLAFKPAAAAAYTAAVDVKDNAAGSPQTIALTGTGIKSTLTDTIIAYAGSGTAGYSGNGAAATKADLYYPQGTAADSAGNLYIADEGNNVIRKVNVSTGVITTVAGNGYGAGMNPGGYSGDGGPATSAELGGPFGVALDKAGNIYIADTYNNVIRKVTASTGKISTVAGNGTSGYSGDGGAATSAELTFPKSVALDTAGNIYISDSFNEVIRKVTISTGKISTIAGGGNGCNAETDEYGDGCPALDANFEVSGYGTGTGGIAIDSKNNIYIADPDVETVRKITAATGIITRVAGTGYRDSNGSGGYTGNGGAATSAELNFPTDVKVDASGNLFIADSHNNVIREVTASTGKISLVAGTYYASGGGKEVVPATAPTAVTFTGPNYISIDPSGNLFIADTGNFKIDKVYGIATATPLNH